MGFIYENIQDENIGQIQIDVFKMAKEQIDSINKSAERGGKNAAEKTGKMLTRKWKREGKWSTHFAGGMMMEKKRVKPFIYKYTEIIVGSPYYSPSHTPPIEI